MENAQMEYEEHSETEDVREYRVKQYDVKELKEHSVLD